MNNFYLCNILLGFFIFAAAADELYPTNFMEAFRWKSKQIHYGTPGRVNNVEFRNLISNSINKFNDHFGNYFEWIFEEDVEDLKKYERYMVFTTRLLFTHDICILSWWRNTSHIFNERDLLGQNTISLIVRNGQNACDSEDVIRLILATLGFYPLTSRIDRDEHIRFLWDQDHKMHVSPEVYSKRYDLANSTNSVFKSFDLASIHMPESFGPDRNGGWSPLFVPVHNNTENWENVLYLDKKVTETDIKQFQAIYHV